VSGATNDGRDTSGVPATGHALPCYDPAGTLREVVARKAFGQIFVPYPKQTAIMERIEALRLSTLGMRGTPLPGLRLSQVSQAGKSRTLERYISDLRAKTEAEGQPANPHQVVYIGLKRRVTVKMLYQRLLMTLGDKHTNVGNLEILTQRAEEFIAHFGVELLIVDEVQHLANTRTDSGEVTDELKAFMDAGLVPVVFAGNEESLRFFEDNNQLAARLGIPLELSPTDVRTRSDAVLFKTFCVQLDEAMVDAGATKMPSDFHKAEIIKALLVASSGHIGRVCRIVGAALDHAARRDANFVEVYDLSHAVRHLAIPSQWVQKNPFPEAGS